MATLPGGTDPVTEVYLVYQVGIANVFCLRESGRLTRVVQSGFRECEWFVRGVRFAGIPILTYHCDEAGDILYRRMHWQAGMGELFKEKKGLIFDV